MHLLFRTLLLFARSRRRARRGGTVDPYEVTRIALRVLPTDLDMLRHVNNGMYLSLFDLGRFDLLVRSGIWDTFGRLGWYPVVASETITFRKSLTLWQRFTIETRILGYDERSVYIEHRAVVKGEVYTQAFVRGRFLKRSGGTVGVPELLEAIGGDHDRDLTVPDWLREWGEASRLPSTRDDARSTWD